VLVFTALQTCGILQGALLSRPHNVLGAVRRGRDYADYSTTTALAQVALAAALALLAAIAAGLGYLSGMSDARLLVACIPAVAAWQLQELGRRMLYTERRLGAAFASDLVAYGGQGVALVLLMRADALTGSSAVLTLAAAFAVGAVAVGWQLRKTLSGTPRRALLGETWHFGRWLGAGELGQWLSTHFTVYLAALVIGPVASAALKAGQALLGPMSVFLTFVTSYLPTQLAHELEAQGTAERGSKRALATTLPVVVTYCAVVGVLAAPALELLYGAEYREYADVVRLFALYYVALGFSTVAVAALTARRLTRHVFLGYAASAVVSVAVGWALLAEIGASGAVVGMLASWAVSMAFFLRALGRRGSFSLPASDTGSGRG
jgi:O-antigen/teichoic acid export membrane protein